MVVITPMHYKFREIAKLREEARKYDSHNRPLREGYEYRGQVGEEAFSIEFGFPMSLEVKRWGDSGIDFHTPAGTVDVKTVGMPRHLFVEAGKVRADIYVLAWYSAKTDTAELKGWATKAEVLSVPPAPPDAHGIVNHVLSYECLRPISSLHKLIEEKRKENGND